MNDRLDNTGYAASALALFALIALAAAQFFNDGGEPSRQAQAQVAPLQQLERATVIGTRPGARIAQDSSSQPLPASVQ